MALAGVDSLFLLAALAAAGSAPRLQCRLTVEPSYRAGGPVVVRFALRNLSERAIAVLDWHTPLEGLLADIFRIVPAGTDEAIPYGGPMVKRGDPEGDEYVTIGPRAEKTAEVDVSAAYDLSRPGRYTITFRGPLLDAAPPREVPRPRGRHRFAAVEPCSAELALRAGS